MTTRPEALIARARREIQAAGVLTNAGFQAQAVSRAYYGAFYAAEAALSALGETRSKHAGVISAFVALLVKPGEIDPDVGRLLRRLFELRSAADYLWLDDSDVTEGDPIGDAATVVEAIARWLERSHASAGSPNVD